MEEKPVFKVKAVKELKILDAKQAQNICKLFLYKHPLSNYTPRQGDHKTCVGIGQWYI